MQKNKNKTKKINTKVIHTENVNNSSVFDKKLYERTSDNAGRAERIYSLLMTWGFMLAGILLGVIFGKILFFLTKF